MKVLFLVEMEYPDSLGGIPQYDVMQAGKFGEFIQARAVHIATDAIAERILFTARAASSVAESVNKTFGG